MPERLRAAYHLDALPSRLAQQTPRPRHAAPPLEPGLRQALGGAVRAELEKPHFRFETGGGLPDFLLTVTRGHMPGQSDRADGRYDGILRYVIEVMGFDDAEYESGKVDMHACAHSGATGAPRTAVRTAARWCWAWC
ncbi:MAG: hypothetical protein OXF26_03125 [Alphaproteobacteria bacterium]|nr:hypothetical protein [Alphaproteobacteria bacterium]MCY4320067.1 hypothetical protein [Alphaproteobacteria bacterium]